ncbi:MAG: glycosyltransferase [Cohaesibacter sp.]|nr:glycosyltransferase [Cohaesibacter sp.]MCV6601822.1 glycosyltransferase [Cohaesibacter sp.]
MTTVKKLRIIHCVRSPFGGIFRHILDLAHQQHLDGHDVGLVLDSDTCSAFEQAKINAEASGLTLGVHKFSIKRNIGIGDILAFWRMYKALRSMKPDIVHTHGAKGGALGRSVASFLPTKPGRLYCPHGGSLHYAKNSLKGRLFFALEKRLERLSDSLIFVSEYEMRSYFAKVGQPKVGWTLAYNGLRDHEFNPIPVTAQTSYDFLMIGQLRDLKGPDLFIKALKALHDHNQKATALIVGSGEDEDKYRQMVAAYGLEKHVTFSAPMPAVDAFSKAHCVVVPSRAESMPYIVLEAIGAHKPIIATDVGGIPEIFGEQAHLLVPCDDVGALHKAMLSKLEGRELAQMQATHLVEQIKAGFSLKVMNRVILDEYRRILRNRPAVNHALTTKSEKVKTAA